MQKFALFFLSLLVIMSGCRYQDHNRPKKEATSAGPTVEAVKKMVTLPNYITEKVENYKHNFEYRTLTQNLNQFLGEFVLLAPAEQEADSIVNFKAILGKQKDPSFIALRDTILNQITNKDLSNASNYAKIAFYINTYNFLAITSATKLMIDGNESPEEDDYNEWIFQVASALSDAPISLIDIRLDILRSLYMDNEKLKTYTFALTCFTENCKSINYEAFEGKRLPEQLDFIYEINKL